MNRIALAGAALAMTLATGYASAAGPSEGALGISIAAVGGSETVGAEIMKLADATSSPGTRQFCWG